MLRIILSLLFFLATGPAWASFGFHAGTHLGLGSLGSESNGTSTRTIGTMDMQFMPGYRLPLGVMFGPMIDFRFMSQITNEAEAGSDFSGNGHMIGIGGTYEITPIKLLFTYDFKASHSFSEPETTYSGGGFHLLFGYEVLPSVFFDFEFVRATYDAMERNGVESDISSDPIRHWNIGIGLSYSF